MGENLYAAIKHEVSTPCNSIGPAIDRLTPVLRVLNVMTRGAKFKLGNETRSQIANKLLPLLHTWPLHSLHRSYAFVDVAEFFDDDPLDTVITCWQQYFPNWRIHLVKFACMQLLAF